MAEQYSFFDKSCVMSLYRGKDDTEKTSYLFTYTSADQTIQIVLNDIQYKQMRELFNVQDLIQESDYHGVGMTESAVTRSGEVEIYK